MENKSKPDPRALIPSPGNQPETIPHIDPDEPHIPEEVPIEFPNENPFEQPPVEIPIPYKEG